jgi:3-oxoacyl-[acyl-carrier protein] reductase
MDAKRVMLVTGSRKGIGRFLAEYYLGLGWRVWGCSRKESDLKHPNYIHTRLDVSCEEDVLRLYERIRREGALQALINNAGIASMNLALLTPSSVARQVMETNFLGTFLFCREAARLMHRSGGRIVNFSTVAVPFHLEGEAVYAASKAAVVSLTQVLARELATYEITVNAVGPTPVKTDLIWGVSATKIDALVKRQAIARLGEFRDVANVVDFFLKPESDFITGQTIYLGGVS